MPILQEEVIGSEDGWHNGIVKPLCEKQLCMFCNKDTFGTCFDRATTREATIRLLIADHKYTAQRAEISAAHVLSEPRQQVHYLSQIRLIFSEPSFATHSRLRRPG